MNGWLYYRILYAAVKEYRRVGYELSRSAPDGFDALLLGERDRILLTIRSWNGDASLAAPLNDDSPWREERVDLIWHPNAFLLSIAEVEERVAVARSMVEPLPPSAVVFGYAALEATLIRLASAFPEFDPPFDHRVASGLLAENGTLNSDEYALLTRCWQLRNRIVHPRGGDRLPDVGVDLSEPLFELIQRLNYGQDSKAVDLLDETARVRSLPIVRGSSDLLRSWILDSNAGEAVKSRAIRILEEVWL